MSFIFLKFSKFGYSSSLFPGHRMGGNGKMRAARVKEDVPSLRCVNTETGSLFSS